MCGIAVVFSLDGVLLTQLSDDTTLSEAAARLRSRGPDQTTVYREPTLAAVTTRLAQWNEGRCEQPLVDDEGGFVAFNGEIFNLDEIRIHLGRENLSEIEVLLAGLRSEGPDFLDRLDGQFALVARSWHDSPLLAARDANGICPLYVGRQGPTVAIGSTPATVATLLQSDDAPLDIAGLADVATEWAPRAGRSCLTGVALLPPGTFRTFSGETLTDRPLGRLAANPTSDDLDELADRLNHSVAARTRSTGEVACLISGGIDSTLISAYAREHGIRKAFGLVLAGDEVTEARQQQVASALDLQLHQLVLHPGEVSEALEDHVLSRRTALARLGPVGMGLLARHARTLGVRTVLSGEGADELFAGYDSARVLAARLGLFGPVNTLPWHDFGEPEAHPGRTARWNAAFWRTVICVDPSNAGVGERAAIITPLREFTRGALRQRLIEATNASQQSPPRTPESLRSNDLDGLLANYLLISQGDQAWAEEGVELRPPYLGASVRQWALGHDPARFVSISGGKTPLRRLMQRLIERYPGLDGLNVAKAAYRIDAAFLLRDKDSADRLGQAISTAPSELFDVAGVLHRFAACARAQRCSEAESVLFLLTASVGLLSRANPTH